MPRQRKNKITLEIPRDVVELTAKEAASLEAAFRSEVANVLSAKVPDSLLSIVIINTARPPATGGTKRGAAKGAAKGAAAKSGSKGSKASTGKRSGGR